MLRYAGELAYRAGLGPQPSDEPDRRLVEIVGGLAAGRALDLGCGAGRNAIFLARQGWDVTGVDMVAPAVAAARSRAAAEGVRARLVVGDVTKLEELGVGDGYTLLVDAGCYHMVPVPRRDAYVAGVTRAAAPGALLLIVGFSRLLGIAMSAEEVRLRFGSWELVRELPVSGPEMQRYVRGPAPIRAALGWGWFEPRRYELRRT